MFELLSTLLKGSNAKAVEVATDHFAIDLLNQKIREAEAGVSGAKQSLDFDPEAARRADRTDPAAQPKGRARGPRAQGFERRQR